MPATSTTNGRTFLFLQGLASPFFAELGETLQARGHRVRRINFSFGDELFWPMPGTSYRGSLGDWRHFLSQFLSDESVTDLVVFGDCRPYHRIAITLAAHRKVQVHVFEEGYLRPNWITVERGGVNGYSSLPRDPAEILRLASKLPVRPEETFRGSFIRRATWDVAYNVAAVLGRPLYPRYRRYRPHHAFKEYAGWIRRIANRKRFDRAADAEVRRVLAHPGGFYLIPLQLDSDYQIRVHSRFASLGEFLEEVVGSFARRSPPEAELLVKVHPFDNGLVDRVAQVRVIAERHGVAARVTCIDGGHMPTLLEAARGVVVVNSTVGTTALEVGRPTVALGHAIYDMPGLSFQGGIDRFWREAEEPDPVLFAAFRRLIVHRTQINGGYFSREGVRMAVVEAADRVEAVEPMIQFRPARGSALPVGLSGVVRTAPAE